VGEVLGRSIVFVRVGWLFGMGGDTVLPRRWGVSEDAREGEGLVVGRGAVFG
jgi:hypothetical protein